VDESGILVLPSETKAAALPLAAWRAAQRLCRAWAVRACAPRPPASFCVLLLFPAQEQKEGRKSKGKN